MFGENSNNRKNGEKRNNNKSGVRQNAYFEICTVMRVYWAIYSEYIVRLYLRTYVFVCLQTAYAVYALSDNFKIINCAIKCLANYFIISLSKWINIFYAFCFIFDSRASIKIKNKRRRHHRCCLHVLSVDCWGRVTFFAGFAETRVNFKLPISTVIEKK